VLICANSAKSVAGDRKYAFVANSYTAPLEKDFKIDANGARAFMGNFLCGVETVKRFVNILSHCNVSNLKKIQAKCQRCTYRGKFSATPMATFTLSTSFDVRTSQVKLTM